MLEIRSDPLKDTVPIPSQVKDWVSTWAQIGLFGHKQSPPYQVAFNLTALERERERKGYEVILLMYVMQLGHDLLDIKLFCTIHFSSGHL